MSADEKPVDAPAPADVNAPGPTKPPPDGVFAVGVTIIGGKPATKKEEA